MKSPFLVKLDCFDHEKFDFEEHYFLSFEDAERFWESYAKKHNDFSIIQYVLPLRVTKRKFHEVWCVEVPDHWRPLLDD